MHIRQYLPSGQFATLVGAIIVSVVLILGAEQLTAAHTKGMLAQVPGTPSSAANWQNTYNAITATPSADTDPTQALLNSSQTNNLTEQLGRSILINTTAAASNGSADDPSVQGEIINETLAQVQPSAPSRPPYTEKDLTIIPDSSSALHDWGNIVVTTLNAHPQATYKNAMYQVALAVDTESSSTLEKLSTIADNYDSLAHDLMSVPVPHSAASYDLTLANTFLQMGAACRDMEATISDPAKGLAGLQSFNTLYNTELSVFTQSAKLLQMNGILFNSSEPGYELSTFSQSS